MTTEGTRGRREKRVQQGPRAFGRPFARRFLAIAGIVALGTGFYAGLRMTAPDMKLSADLFYDGTKLMDVRVLSTLGLTDDDLEALRATDGVESVMGAYETDAMATIKGEQLARAHPLAARGGVGERYGRTA